MDLTRYAPTLVPYLGGIATGFVLAMIALAMFSWFDGLATRLRNRRIRKQASRARRLVAEAAAEASRDRPQTRAERLVTRRAAMETRVASRVEPALAMAPAVRAAEPAPAIAELPALPAPEPDPIEPASPEPAAKPLVSLPPMQPPAAPPLVTYQTQPLVPSKPAPVPAPAAAVAPDLDAMFAEMLRAAGPDPEKKG